MAEIFEICRQDFTVAKVAFEESDFRLMNILANRLMSNVLFGKEDEKIFALPGLFLKDVAVEFLAVKEENGTEELHRIAKRSIVQVEDAFKADFDLDRFWTAWLKYHNDTRKLNMTAAERKIYKDNPAFTDQAVSFLSKELFEGDSVFLENSLIIKGFLQEMDRIVRCYGVTDADAVLGFLVRVLDWLNEYYRQACSSAPGLVNSECVKSKLSPFLERVRRWRAEGEQLPFKNGSAILCDCIIEWRRCFVIYMERGRLIPDAERRIELPVDAKKRIGDTIAEALQKDVAPKRGRR